MAELLRYTQQIFASSAGNNQLSEYGSFIAAPPGNLYSGSTITPAIVQQLGNYLEGLYAATGGAYSPTIQDQNSLFYLLSYQLAYILQSGISEWDAGTTYFTNQYVRSGRNLYVSLQDNNLNNAVTNNSYWSTSSIDPLITTYTTPGASGTYTTSSTNIPLYLRIKIVGGGGGGGGGNIGVVTAGSDGSDSVFGNFIAGKGAGAYFQFPNTTYGFGGPGGIPSISGSNYKTILSVQGGNGGNGNVIEVNSASVSNYLAGGNGGSSFFGSSFECLPASSNNIYGSGGHGQGAGATSGFLSCGGGGGAAAYIEGIITNPGIATSFSYTVGQGGAQGSGANDSSKGGGGYISIEEVYQ